ncbi:interleukin-1 receptor type 1 [Anolis carolinensis]|uniref:Interleukin 1 receptor type 1 n=1 Tax=Anolis carolinensis TaxID=28377 RepID=H9GCP0_ANOCA|nr:PREDICTED: interleukin-1 receptor type 1 isoform X2 [Anolis carolinensis]|eukprot:XP_008114352.1 PREDICTED: interleukin-1 receptor type 1 isoform X2 [Anolis carolinensis]
MISALWWACWISLTYSSLSFCVAFPTYVPVGEPYVIRCPRRSLPSNYSLTWYINGSDIPITTNNISRIHQRGDLLWFVPTILEDTGSYQCVINNATKRNKDIEVVQNDDGLCFNSKTTYPQKVALSKTRQLICPDLDDFEDKDSSLVIQWYKACSPRLLKGDRYWAFEGSFFITNVTKNDEGIYICRANYTYMGKQYYVSRPINLTTYDSPPEGPIEILYPKNHSIEVELGASISINCTASRGLSKDVFIEWNFSGEQPEDYLSTYEKYKKKLPEKWISVIRFNISKMKANNYGRYSCVADSFGTDQRVAYVMLHRPAPNFQGYLIGGLVSALFVILAALLTYKFFKVDIVLWYRESYQTAFRERVSDGKLYDAYVLYPRSITNCAYSSDIFVLKALPEVLEKQCGYKLFIFGRDDLPGQAVVTVVDETIKRSRRVIIVLVPGSSPYGIQEVSSEHEIAVYSALIRDGIKVILIELAKIKDYSNMAESIKYLKKKHGVLTWQGDFSAKSQMATTRFWKNVRYQMPTNKISPSLDLHFWPVILNSSQISDG